MDFLLHNIHSYFFFRILVLVSGGFLCLSFAMHNGEFVRKTDRGRGDGERNEKEE